MTWALSWCSLCLKCCGGDNNALSFNNITYNTDIYKTNITIHHTTLLPHTTYNTYTTTLHSHGANSQLFCTIYDTKTTTLLHVSEIVIYFKLLFRSLYTDTICSSQHYLLNKYAYTPYLYGRNILAYNSHLHIYTPK